MPPDRGGRPAATRCPDAALRGPGDNPGGTTQGGQPRGTTQGGQTMGGQPKRYNPGGTTKTKLFKFHCSIYYLIFTIALEVIPPKGVDVNQECQCGEILEGNPNEGLLSIANLANKIVGGNPAEKVECT